MKKGTQKPEPYTIEREFLGKITPSELVSRIVRAGLTKDMEQRRQEGRPL